MPLIALQSKRMIARLRFRSKAVIEAQYSKTKDNVITLRQVMLLTKR